MQKDWVHKFNFGLLFGKIQELQLNIWRCSVTIQHQSVSKAGSKEERKKIQMKIWELIKPAPVTY